MREKGEYIQKSVFYLTCRNETKGDVSVEKMDLASLASISACVERLKKSVEKVDILVNNAGVMMCPLSKTEDGFEMQIGTNHFGHFYLTNLLLPMIKKVVLCLLVLKSHRASCVLIFILVSTFENLTLISSSFPNI